MGGAAEAELDVVARLTVERRLGAGDEAPFFAQMVDENVDEHF
jgi:hypothetical protein